MSAAFALLDQLGDDMLKPVLDSRVFVEPKDKGKVSENGRQWEWVKHNHQHSKRLLIFAVPNGTHIASYKGRAKVKREGLYTGFPDTGATWDGVVAFLEWKDGTGELSDNQIECLNRLVAMGHPCGVFRTLECANNWLAGLGAPLGRLS